MKKYFKLLPHGQLKEIVPSIYMITGTMKLFGIFQYSRSMTILKNKNELALVNPVRVNDTELDKICQLGEIKHIFKIGRLHSVDVPFYLDKFSAKLWVSKGDNALPNYKPDYIFNDFDKLPFMDIKVIPINGSKLPETVLLVPQNGGSILSCDAFVNMGPDSRANWLTGNLMKLLKQPTYIGPNWVKRAKPPKQEMLRVLDFDFCNLIPAHGPAILKDADIRLRNYLESW